MWGEWPRVLHRMPRRGETLPGEQSHLGVLCAYLLCLLICPPCTQNYLFRWICLQEYNLYIYIECHHYCDTCAAGGSTNNTVNDHCACLSSNFGVFDLPADGLDDCRCNIAGGYTEIYNTAYDMTQCISIIYIYIYI